MAELASPVWSNVSCQVLAHHDEPVSAAICHYYDYVTTYCMHWQPDACTHPGMDIWMPYGTALYAPADGTITCAGTGVGRGYDGGWCAAYTDAWGGAGRVELLLDDQTVVIFGHCSQALYPVGTRVTAGTAIARSGFENSAHLHFEVRRPNPSCSTGYAIVDPMPLLTGGIVRPPVFFQPGNRIRVAGEALRLRTQPGTLATIITMLPPATELDVLGGPTAADGYDWYQVRVVAGATRQWRGIGATSAAVWRTEFQNLASPMLPEVDACHAASGQHSALCLAMAWVEQKYGTFTEIIPATNRNPMSLRGAGPGGWQQFGSYADGIAAWYRLLSDPAGPYGNTRTLPELIHVYAPGWDPPNNEAQYLADVERLVARYRSLEGGGPASVAAGESGFVAGQFCVLASRYRPGDLIQVADGPLRIRAQPSTAATVLSGYQTGTEICVQEGPVFADGHEWYRVAGFGQAGWVAGDLCVLLTSGGCA